MRCGHVLCAMVLTQMLRVMLLTHDTHQAAKIERATCRNCGLDYMVQDNLVGTCKCAHNGSTSQVPLLSTARSPPPLPLPQRPSLPPYPPAPRIRDPLETRDTHTATLQPSIRLLPLHSCNQPPNRRAREQKEGSQSPGLPPAETNQLYNPATSVPLHQGRCI